MVRAIYLGLPVYLCQRPGGDGDDTTCFGFWSWVPSLWFNGAFFVFRGSYLRALWYWLRHSPEDPGDDCHS